MGVSSDQKKYDVIVKRPTPNSVKDVRRFLGQASYYRRFVQNFASIASPLHKLTQKGIKFTWSAECQEAFDTLKHCLSSSPVLKYPAQEGKFIPDTVPTRHMWPLVPHCPIKMMTDSNIQ